MENRKVVVVGAGIGGLAAGYWLCQRGYEVEILEASERPAGRMVTLERKGDRVDVGAQFYHSAYRCANELMNVTNLRGTQRSVSGNVQYTLKDGSIHLLNNRTPYMKLIGFRGNLKLYWFVLKYIVFGHHFDLYWIDKDIPEYDNVEALELFQGPSDQPLRDYVVEPVALGAAEGKSLYHIIRQLRYGLFHQFIGLTGGVASLAEELAKLLPVRYGSPVRQLVIEKGRIVGVQMENDGSVKRAGHVIVAVTPSAAARLMPEELEEQREFFDSVIHSPVLAPVFFLDRPLRKDVWCYFNDPSLRRPFMTAVDGRAKIPEMVPSGKSVLTAWAAHPMSLDLIDLPEDEIIKKAREDIELMIPGFSGWIEEAKLFRHPYGVAKYHVGSYRRVLDFVDQAKSLKGVSFVSDVLGGGYTESAMISAKAAVSRVCQWGGTA